MNDTKDLMTPEAIMNAVPSALIRPEQCNKCKFVFSEGGGFTCRRNPPAATGMMTKNGIVPVSFFPPVQPLHWCGEFRPKISI